MIARTQYGIWNLYTSMDNGGTALSPDLAQ